MGDSLSDAETEVNCGLSMLPRLRRFLDVRPGEGLPVLLTFLYIGVVVASFLLAKPIRNGLFLEAVRAVRPRLRLRRGAAGAVAVRAGLHRASPRASAPARSPSRRWCSSASTSCCSGTRSGSIRSELLPGIFYVWVNCFGVIAPVQAWSFANSLFDTRQAKRLFGLIGAGASLGAIIGGCWRGSWSGRSAARSTCCWCSRLLIAARRGRSSPIANPRIRARSA